MSSETLPATRSAADVRVGDRLGDLSVPVTPTFVISTALATRDFQDVHHDPELARRRGSRDIFLNILTTKGLVQRFVTDWAGPEALVREISVRLGTPCYPHSVLTFTGEVTGRADDDADDGADGDGGGGREYLRHVVRVRGSTDLGDHVVATVQIDLPGEEASR